MQKNLADRLDEFASPWRAKPGDKLIGVVVDVDTRDSTFDAAPYPVVTVETEDGSTEDGQLIPPGSERAWHGFHTVARNELKKLAPQVGERIGVAYHGKGEKSYERYRVVVDRPRKKVNWDAMPTGDVPEDEPAVEKPAETKQEPEEDDDIPF